MCVCLRADVSYLVGIDCDTRLINESTSVPVGEKSRSLVGGPRLEKCSTRLNVKAKRTLLTYPFSSCVYMFLYLEPTTITG